jgi:hypothetical protein
MPYGYDVTQLGNTAISGAVFAQKLKNIPAKKLVVILDCCHAGGVGEAKAAGLALVKSPIPPEAQALLAGGSGRVLIASSTEDELSYAGKPYSAFTLALIEAFSGVGVAKKDGYVRVTDLALRAREVVPARTKDRQHPILHFEKADNFALAYYAGGYTEPKGLPFEMEPEIEPEPGAWAASVQIESSVQVGDISQVSGGEINIAGRDVVKKESRKIDTGGGAYIEGGVSTGGGDFVGRDKITYSGAQEGVTLEQFSELLQQIQVILSQAGLDQETAQEIEDDLARAQQQASQPEPNGKIILKRLDSMVEFMANTATVLASAPQLYEMGQQALAWAQQLFK